MSLKYRNASGVETPVAGLNGTSGELVPSVSYYQKGSKLSDTSSWAPGESGVFSVIFSNPMPDTSYDVILSIDTPEITVSVAYDKSVNGFKAKVENVSSVTYAGRIELYWTAFKLMTDESRALDETHMAQNTANFAPAFSEVTSYAVGDYVTYNNILYRCTTAHTAGTWVAGHFTQVTVGGTLSDIVPNEYHSTNAHIVATLPNNSLYRVTVDKHLLNSEMGVFLIGVYGTTSLTLLKIAESTAGKFTISHTAATTVEITDTVGGHIWAKVEYLGSYT